MRAKARQSICERPAAQWAGISLAVCETRVRRMGWIFLMFTLRNTTATCLQPRRRLIPEKDWATSSRCPRGRLWLSLSIILIRRLS